MRRRLLIVWCLGCWFVSMGACSSPQNACPSLLEENADNSRCCEALRFCCDHLSGTETEIKAAKEECNKFVNGTDLSCKSQYYSFLSFGQCKPLTVSPGTNSNTGKDAS